MKRILVLLLTLCMLFAFAACGGKGLTVSELQAALNDADSSLSLEATSDASVYADSTEFADYTVNTENNRVTSVKIEVKAAVGKLANAALLKEVINKSSGELTVKDIKILECIILFGDLKEVFGGSPIQEQESLDFFASQKPIKAGNWTISAEYTSDTVIISATSK